MDTELTKVVNKIAKDIGGTVSDYDDTTSIFVVPLERDRFQTVRCTIQQFVDASHSILEVSSRVCPFTDKLDTKMLLEENTKFCHAKFSIIDNYLNVEGSAFVYSIEEHLLKEIILEVSSIADKWEYKFTGKDEN